MDLSVITWVGAVAIAVLDIFKLPSINVEPYNLQDCISLLVIFCVEFTYNKSSNKLVGSTTLIILLLFNLNASNIGLFNVLFDNVSLLVCVTIVSEISGNVNILLFICMVDILGCINVLLFNVCI